MRRISLTGLLSGLALLLPVQAGWAAGDWIVSAHAGQTEVDRLIRSEGTWWNRIDDDSSSFGLSLGYDFFPELGVRLMYERAGSLRGINRCPAGQTCPAIVLTEGFDADLWSAAVVPRWYITHNWSIFGTAGLTHWRIGSGRRLPGDNGTDLTYGAGTSWLVTPEFELGVEYQRSEMDHETWRLNLGWRFGAW